MIFANIEYLFLLVLLIPYIIWYVMRRQKTEPTLHVYEGIPKLENLPAACPVCAPNGGHRHGNSHFGASADHRQLAEYRNRRYRHHAGGRRFHQYAGRRFET